MVRLWSCLRHVERFENKSGELVKDAPRAPRLLCRKKDMRITRTITVVIETVETLIVWRRGSRSDERTMTPEALAELIATDTDDVAQHKVNDQGEQAGAATRKRLLDRA